MTRKGGLFGKRRWKTKSNNKKNCHRLAENYTPKYDFLYDKYCIHYRKECKRIAQHAGLHIFCENDEYIDAYDFSGDGKRVKKRTKPFLDVKTVPDDVSEYPWNEMPDYFIKSGDDYILKD